MADDFQRRIPSVEREVTGIRPEDIRVSVLGTIIDKNPEGKSIVVDDGTGKIAARFESPVKQGLNQLVRVFGRVIPMENGAELQADVIQDMGSLDLDLRKRVKGLKI